MGWDVTKYWSISYEIGTQKQRDQCQNCSLGHNFCHNTINYSQRRKKLPLLIIHQIWHVTKSGSILLDIGVPLQRDQCQNFSSGHNVMDKTFD